jgi:hypothetical protein
MAFLFAATLVLPTTLAAQYGYGNGDSGQYVIQSAQYGTAQHHVDVTARLKELARADRTFRMGNSTFGTDPDPGHQKTLHIYARGPRGEERMFEYAEGSTVDGSQFRGWGSGEWGNTPWNGQWQGGGYGDNDHDADDRYRNGDYRNAAYAQNQPEMTAALEHLRQAADNLQRGSHDKGGHRQRALDLVNQAMREVQAGIEYDNTHHDRGER